MKGLRCDSDSPQSSYIFCLFKLSMDMSHHVDVALELNAAEAKLAAVEWEVQKFQKWLGLTFVRSEGELEDSDRCLPSKACCRPSCRSALNRFVAFGCHFNFFTFYLLCYLLHH